MRTAWRSWIHFVHCQELPGSPLSGELGTGPRRQEKGARPVWNAVRLEVAYR